MLTALNDRMLDPDEVEKMHAAGLDPKSRDDRSMFHERRSGKQNEHGDQAVEAPRPFRFMRAGELKLTAPAWLIRNLLELDTLAEVFGDPGCCKTFFAADIACSLATETEFHGLKVKRVPVFCIVGEGHNGLARRTKAWSIARAVSLDDAPLFFSNRAAQLLDPANEVDVYDAIDAVATEHGKPGLIVVDTLARNFGPGDENSTSDMSRFIQACDRLRARYGCAVLLVHHTGHGDKLRSRGSMALKGGVDTEIRIDKDDTGIVRVTVTKTKDSTPPEPMAFELRVVELPLLDDEGQPITSAVLQRTDYEAPAPKGKQGSGKWQRVALECLEQVTEKHRAAKESGGYNSNTARVMLGDWREACEAAGMIRQTFYKVRDSLSECGAIHVDTGGFVYAK